MTLLAILNCVAAGLITLRACVVLNEMSSKTRHTIRLAYWLMGFGAFLVLIDPLFFIVEPDVPEVLLHAGLAVLVLANHRKPENSRPQQDDGNDHTIYVRPQK